MGHPAWGSVWDMATHETTVMDVATNVFCASGMHLPNGSFVTFGGAFLARVCVWLMNANAASVRRQRRHWTRGQYWLAKEPRGVRRVGHGVHGL
jgi:hypothetical protein